MQAETIDELWKKGGKGGAISPIEPGANLPEKNLQQKKNLAISRDRPLPFSSSTLFELLHFGQRFAFLLLYLR